MSYICQAQGKTKLLYVKVLHQSLYIINPLGVLTIKLDNLMSALDKSETFEDYFNPKWPQLYIVYTPRLSTDIFQEKGERSVSEN